MNYHDWHYAIIHFVSCHFKLFSNESSHIKIILDSHQFGKTWKYCGKFIENKSCEILMGLFRALSCESNIENQPDVPRSTQTSAINSPLTQHGYVRCRYTELVLDRWQYSMYVLMGFFLSVYHPGLNVVRKPIKVDKWFHLNIVVQIVAYYIFQFSEMPYLIRDNLEFAINFDSLLISNTECRLSKLLHVGIVLISRFRHKLFTNIPKVSPLVMQPKETGVNGIRLNTKYEKRFYNYFKHTNI